MAQPGDDPDTIFARRFRALREAAELTQRQVADQASLDGYRMHQTTVAKIEAGERPVIIGEAVTLARIIGVDLADLLTPPPADHDVQLAIAALEAARRNVAHLAADRDKADAAVAEACHRLAEAQAALRAAEANLASLTTSSIVNPRTRK